MSGLIERQVIATWYTPKEKLPPEAWDSCLLTISGEVGRTKFDHVFAIGGYDPDDSKVIGFGHFMKDKFVYKDDFARITEV